MPRSLQWLYQRLGKRYFSLWFGFECVTAVTITLATCGLFALYEDMPSATFWQIVLVSEGAVALALVYTALRTHHLARPVLEWVAEGRPPGRAADVWRCVVSLPRDGVLTAGPVPFAIVGIPVSLYVTAELNLPWYSAAVIFAVSLVAVAYAGVLHFFASEQFLKPVIEDVTRHLPADWAAQPAGVSLRWKLLGALPLINVITGVVVSGLSTDATASLRDLGVDVVLAVIVAFTISLELTLLVTKSVLGPVDGLLAATERVKRGDLDVRVPVTSGDELGRLAGSFNEMLEGLSERERLQSALGSYVDPEVAQRVLTEGELLKGQEVEVTLLFADIRGFTPFAESASARETVAFLNEFFDLIVPVVLRHGGRANKFVGDGMLAVFGAPVRLEGHADHALAAACEMADAVSARFGDRIGMGVGLNSGPVVVGSVGGGGRLEFAAIGDAVNVASRVERVTRETHDRVLLTEAVRDRLERPEAWMLEERGQLPIKGKSEPVTLYAAAGLDIRISRAPSGLTTGA